MALAITVFAGEGIVMASDALDVSYMRAATEGSTFQPYISHAAEHTLLCPNGAGLSFCGATIYQGEALALSVRRFIEERIKPDTQVDDIPWMLFDHYYSRGEVPHVSFLLAGYQNGEQKVSKLRMETRACEVMNTKSKGAVWTGETSFVTRLLMPTTVGEDAKPTKPELPWGLYSLEEACALARFLIDGAATYAGFKAGLPQVGPLSDMLVLTPDGAHYRVRHGKTLD